MVVVVIEEIGGAKSRKGLIVAVEAGIGGRYFASLIYAGLDRIIHAGTLPSRPWR